VKWLYFSAAKEKTKEKLMEALRIGAKEMLATEISFEPNSFMTTISIPESDWTVNTGHI